MNKVDYHFICGKVIQKCVQVKFISSANQLAEMLTKRSSYFPFPLSNFHHDKLISFLLLDIVDAENFLVYHVPLWEWAERGLSCLEGMLSPKLYTRLVDLLDG